MAFRRCIPIASLVTPATLSVQSTLITNSSLLQVPQFDFVTLDFVNGMHQDAGLNDWSRMYSFNGPSQPVQRIANAVAGLGQILPISPPASNVSWTLDMYGPTMQCAEVEDDRKTTIWTNVWNSFGACSTMPYAYLGWTPCASDGNAAVPFQLADGTQTPGFCGNTSTTQYINIDSNPLELYLATTPFLARMSFSS